MLQPTLEVGTRVRSCAGARGRVVDAEFVACLGCNGTRVSDGLVFKKGPCQQCLTSGLMELALLRSDRLKQHGPIVAVLFENKKLPVALYEGALRPLSIPELLAEIPT